MKPKVAIIAPYQELRLLAQEVISEYCDSIIVVEGDLYQGVAAAKQAVEDGAEVIISRGGTAFLISQAIDIPVVEIEVSPFDIIRCLLQLKDYEGPIGVIGFENFVQDCDSIGKMLNIDLRRIVIHSRQDTLQKMSAAAQEGIRLVIGGVMSINHASDFGLRGILISSGKEAVAKSVREAVRLAEVRSKERERAELIRIFANRTQEGIIVVDREERITLFNPIAEKIYGMTASEVAGERISEKIPTSQLSQALQKGKSDFSEFQTIGDKSVIAQYYTIKIKNQVLGAVANLHDVTEIQRLERLVRQKLHAQGLVAKSHFDDLIGKSNAMLELKEKAKKFAKVNTSILIMGESGTGKELLAQSIHNDSKRFKGPFVAVNCAAFPESLLESELFGYEAGAFTGAKKGGKHGLFELAHGGTLFLDEIGEMPIHLQSRLLRIIQEKAVLRIGGDHIIPIDVRVITATNRNIKTLISEGQFRQDLYYRLNNLTLFVPPLRDRKDDVPVLVEYFLKKHAYLNSHIEAVENSAMNLLESYQWPGNVRELEHIVERMAIIGQEPIVNSALVKELLLELDLDQFWGQNSNSPVSDKLDEVEINTIHDILEDENYNKSKAAKRLGISRSTLWRKLKECSKIEQ